jgi:hypothetical protein
LKFPGHLTVATGECEKKNHDLAPLWRSRMSRCKRFFGLVLASLYGR